MDNILHEIRNSSLENIKLDVFEGPFDLLLTLLERNKLDIADIKISLIADQYIDVLSANFDMDIASEFLVMASTLLHMKSKRMLPKEEKEEVEISEEELIRRLKEYRRFKTIAPSIAERYELWSKSIYRMPENLDFPKVYAPVSIDPAHFNAVYDEIIKRNNEKKEDNSAKMARILKVEKVSIRDKMKQIIGKLTTGIKSTFSAIFTRKNTRMERVTGFLAILELDRRKHITIKQDKLFGEIELQRGEDFEKADLNILENEIDNYDTQTVQ